MNNVLSYIRIIIIRLLEMILPCIAFSMLATGLNVIGLSITSKSIVVILSVSVIFYMMINSRCSKNLFFALGDKTQYRILSGICIALLAAIIYAVRHFAGNVIFVWLFAITKCFYFLSVKIPLIVSIALFMAILLAVVMFAPAGMEYMVERSKPDEFDSFESAE